MECSQPIGECLYAPCRIFHRFKDIKGFHLWGQSRQIDVAPGTSLESLQRYCLWVAIIIILYLMFLGGGWVTEVFLKYYKHVKNVESSRKWRESKKNSLWLYHQGRAIMMHILLHFTLRKQLTKGTFVMCTYRLFLWWLKLLRPCNFKSSHLNSA